MLSSHHTLHKQQFVWLLSEGGRHIHYVCGFMRGWVIQAVGVCECDGSQKFILVFINFRIQRILKIYAVHRLSMWQLHKQHHQHHHHPHCCLLWKINTKKCILLRLYVHANFTSTENSTNTISIDDHFLFLFSKKNFLTLSIFPDLSAHILQIVFLIINFPLPNLKKVFGGAGKRKASKVAEVNVLEFI